MGRLDDRTALVTGGAAGLGKAIATRLGEEGATVVITDINHEAGAALAAELGFTFVEHDVCAEKRWEEVVRETEEQYGALHILVNNAGIIGRLDDVTLEDTRLDNWRRIFEVNVEGVFLGCRAAIAPMRRAGVGSIVNISSVAGLLATPHHVAYGASKAAVRHLTKSVAQHCAEHGLNIRCNSVHPGDVRTPLWDGWAERASAERGVSVDDFVAQAASRVPLGDMTLPEDVAAAVAFLASDDSRHITGTKVIVDGGFTSCDTYQIREHAYAGSADDD